MSDSPRYPVSVRDLSDSSTEVFENEEELVSSLEWFDSDDPSYNSIVTDALGRRIRLKVQRLELVTFVLADHP